MDSLEIYLKELSENHIDLRKTGIFSHAQYNLTFSFFSAYNRF